MTSRKTIRREHEEGDESGKKRRGMG